MYTDNEPMPVKVVSQAGGGQAQEDTQLDIYAELQSIDARLTDIQNAANTTGANYVAGVMRAVPVTLTLDTAQYADGDLMFEDIECAGAARENDVPFALVAVKVYGEDDQGQPFDIYFSNLSADWGTLNSAPTVSDANARGIQGKVAVASTDFYDLGNMRFADKAPLCIPMLPVGSSTSIRLFGISRGTGTYTANGLRLLLFFSDLV